MRLWLSWPGHSVLLSAIEHIEWHTSTDSRTYTTVGYASLHLSTGEVVIVDRSDIMDALSVMVKEEKV